MESGLKPRVFDSQLHECLTIAWIFHKVYNEQRRFSYNWLSSQKVVNTIGFFYLFSSRSSVVQVWGCVWVCSLWWLAETFTIYRNQTPRNSILQMMFIKWSFLLSQPKIILIWRHKQEQRPGDILRGSTTENRMWKLLVFLVPMSCYDSEWLKL